MEEKDKIAESNKFTYEQLENIAGNLSSQVQQLSARLQEANMFNTFKRLDYLFKVVEAACSLPVTIFSTDFAERCAKEIEELMTLPTPEDKETDE